MPCIFVFSFYMYVYICILWVGIVYVDFFEIWDVCRPILFQRWIWWNFEWYNIKLLLYFQIHIFYPHEIEVALKKLHPENITEWFMEKNGIKKISDVKCRTDLKRPVQDVLAAEKGALDLDILLTNFVIFELFYVQIIVTTWTDNSIQYSRFALSSFWTINRVIRDTVEDRMVSNWFINIFRILYLRTGIIPVCRFIS